jgi:hypothetical protein
MALAHWLRANFVVRYRKSFSNSSEPSDTPLGRSSAASVPASTPYAMLGATIRKPVETRARSCLIDSMKRDCKPSNVFSNDSQEAFSFHFHRPPLVQLFQNFLRPANCISDPYLRTLLVQGAHHILGPFGADSDLRRWGLKLAERGGKNGKKRAVIATARKLAVLLHRLWVSGEAYEPLRKQQPSANAAQFR